MKYPITPLYHPPISPPALLYHPPPIPIPWSSNFSLSIIFLRSDVTPELLLPPASILAWVRSHVSHPPSNPGNPAVSLRPSTSAEASTAGCVAWTRLLAQMLRVFVVARVTAASMSGVLTPGGTALSTQSNLEPAMGVGGDCLHSPEELRLLAWLSHHHQTAPGNRSRVTNFSSDLCDGLVLASLLQAHIIGIGDAFFTDLFLEPSNMTQRHHNAARVVRAFQFAELEFPLTPDDILLPAAPGMVLLVAFLFDRLPGFLVKRAPLLFRSVMHVAYTRQLKVSNSTAKVVRYGYPPFSLLPFSLLPSPPPTLTLPFSLLPFSLLPSPLLPSPLLPSPFSPSPLLPFSPAYPRETSLFLFFFFYFLL